ncbi:MAG: type II secretion system F family protein [Candidatus Aenigmarchaeota archaeon]|nr:type II secretion system F family protein [Candidatus Aenigmarchaeota archaeon]
MGFYTRFGMRIFGELAEKITSYFSDTADDLRKAGFELSIQEYLSMAILTSFLVFIFEMLPLTFIISVVTKGASLFSFFSAFLLSCLFSALIFLLFTTYPRAVIRDKSADIDRALPLTTLHLFTIAQTKLPLSRIFRIFSRFVGGETKKEVERIITDIEVFGFDVNTALERAIDRSPSKNFRELLWGILSTNKAGGDLGVYLKEKSSTFLEDYRRKLYEFSHQLAIYIEIYLVAIILGAIFFTILTAIFAGIAGVAWDIISVQFFLITFFTPLVAVFLIIFIKSVSPGGE